MATTDSDDHCNWMKLYKKNWYTANSYETWTEREIDARSVWAARLLSSDAAAAKAITIWSLMKIAMF